MAKKKKKGKGYVYYVDPDKTRTVAIRGSGGKFLGRRSAKPKERSDQIFNVRVKSPKEASGQFRGFLPSGVKRIPVKASNRSRATVRRRLD